MTKEEFVTHACEQVLRFTRVENWDNLSEERKVQLGFNMGVVAIVLNLTKEEGYMTLSNARQGTMTMRAFREHLQSVIDSHKIPVDESKIARPF